MSVVHETQRGPEGRGGTNRIMNGQSLSWLRLSGFSYAHLYIHIYSTLTRYLIGILDCFRTTREEDSKGGLSTSTSILTFRPGIEDNNRILACRAENKAIPGSALEQAWKLDVHCKLYSLIAKHAMIGLLVRIVIFFLHVWIFLPRSMRNTA